MRKILSLFLLGTALSHGGEKSHVSIGGIDGNNNTSNVSLTAQKDININCPTHHHHYYADSPIPQEETEQYFINAVNYEFGRGVSRNIPEACELYKKLVAHEHNGARYQLGTLYLEGHGIERNRMEGIRLLKLACDSGYVKAEHAMSHIYMEGKHGESKDTKPAYELLFRAARNGYELAQLEFRRLLTSLNLNSSDFLSDLLDALTTGCPKEGCHLIQPSWRGNEWFLDVFQMMVRGIDTPKLFENAVYAGYSFLDVCCLYKQASAFNVLIEKGAGICLKTDVLISFYKDLKEAKIEYPNNEEITKALTSFETLEEKNSHLKFQMAIEHLCGGAFNRVPPSSYRMLRVTNATNSPHTDTKLLPLSILHFDEERKEYTNKVKRINQEGRGTVATVNHGKYTLYFKFFPEISGIEAAVSTLTHDLIGFGAPPSELFKIPESLCIPVLIPIVKKGIFRDTVSGEEISGERSLSNIPVLVSLGIDGSTLKDVFSQLKDVFSQPIDPETGLNVFEQLDSESLYQMILVAMLVNPEDGKSDNYIVEKYTKEKGKLKYRIIGIDNDHAFVPALVEMGERHVKINTKTILYAFDEIGKPIPPSVCHHFREKLQDIDSLLRSWLCRLRALNDTYATLFPSPDHEDSETSHTDSERDHNRLLFEDYHSFIGIPFAPHALSHLYTKLTKLRDALTIGNEEFTLTPLDLFFELEPLLNGRYGQALHSLKHMNAFDRFITIEGEAAHKTLSRSLDVLTSYNIPNDPGNRHLILKGKAYSPGQASVELEDIIIQTHVFEKVASGEIDAFKRITLEQLVEEALQNIDFGQFPANVSKLVNDAYLEALQEKLHQGLIKKLTLINHQTVKTLHLKNWPDSAFQYLTQLTLSGCQRMSKNSVLVLAKNMKSLRYLSLSNNNAITMIATQEEGTFSSSLPLTFKHNTLTHLDVSHCGSLHQINLEATNLERLHVNGCQQLTFIKGQFPRLHYVDMRDTPALDTPKLGDFILSNPQFFKDGHLEIEDAHQHTELIKNAKRFLNGRLVYNGPAGERSFLIADSVNSSLEGEFNLNGLTYTSVSTTYNISDYLRIKIGYRKAKENEEKTTVWIVPQFVSRAGGSSFSTAPWTSDVGIFWTWGKDDVTYFDYLTSMQFDEISSKNLHELGRPADWGSWRGGCAGGGCMAWAWARWWTRYFYFIFN